MTHRSQHDSIALEEPPQRNTRAQCEVQPSCPIVEPIIVDLVKKRNFLSSVFLGFPRGTDFAVCSPTSKEERTSPQSTPTCHAKRPSPHRTPPSLSLYLSVWNILIVTTSSSAVWRCGGRGRAACRQRQPSHERLDIYPFGRQAGRQARGRGMTNWASTRRASYFLV